MQNIATDTKSPNFFILGAPKCGTTSMSEYLRSHPNVFVCTPKEPHFFSPEFKSYHHAQTAEEYIALFSNAADCHEIRCDASTTYLWSDSAIDEISASFDEPYCLVMVRNPVDLAYSLHMENLMSFNESEPDFELAWDLQSERRAGRAIPSTCLGPEVLQYKKVASIGTQMHRVMRLVSPERLHVIFYEDFCSNTKRVYDQLLRFLNLPGDERIDFHVANASRQVRWQRFRDYLKKPPFISDGVEHWFRNAVWAVGGRGLRTSLLHRVFHSSGRRPPLDPAFRTRLVDEFRDEIALLAELRKRDLADWLS